jgi:glycosyltransferase involved in cell wall biosynthesis
MPKHKIAIVVSHPIQHFCPMYASWAANVNFKLKVFFASAKGVKKYFDPSFKKEISWNNLYLDKFEHEFLNDGKTTELNKEIDTPGIKKKLDEYNPDILIVYGYTQKLQQRAKNWAKENNKKILMISDAELRHYRPLYVRLLKHFLIPKKLSDFDGFLTTGDANEEYYHHYGVEKHKFFRSPLPIDIFIYEHAIKERNILRNKIREKYKISENEIVLTNVGKFVKWKRQIDILKSLKELENKNIGNIFLFLIGSGEEKKFLQREANKLVHNKVIFTGFINPEELPAYYAATDIYVHPSERDAHSLSVSEAVYMGCPVIISDTCGSYGKTDDVQRDFNGYIFSSCDINTLSKSIEKLYSETDTRKLFSKNSIQIGIESQVRAHKDGLQQFINDIKAKDKIQ